MSRAHTNTTSAAVQGMVVGSRERECWRRNAEIAMRPFLSGWGVGTLGVQKPAVISDRFRPKSVWTDAPRVSWCPWLIGVIKGGG